LRFFVFLFILLGGMLPVRHAQSAAALERGTAIIDPLALRELDSGRFGLGRVLLPARSADAPLDKPRPGRRRTATTTAGPGPAGGSAPETVKPARRASRKAAAAEATQAEIATETTTAAKPARRGTRKASPPEAAPEPLPGPTKHLRPRAARRAAAAAASTAPSNPARRRTTTKTPVTPSEPAADQPGTDDELLPGGPDPS
jgi:hypothetical protein